MVLLCSCIVLDLSGSVMYAKRSTRKCEQDLSNILCKYCDGTEYETLLCDFREMISQLKKFFFTIILEFNRPKSVLVFINPHGGKKKAPKVYRDKVAPLFELAGITTDVIGM